MHMITTDKPYGRVHIDQRTGQPARYIGGALTPDNVPPATAFFDPGVWANTSWDFMTKQERKDYKRQYPVV